MSHAVDDDGRFYVNPYTVNAPLQLSFRRTGELVIEIGADERRVELDGKTARALLDWLDQHVGGDSR